MSKYDIESTVQCGQEERGGGSKRSARPQDRPGWTGQAPWSDVQLADRATSAFTSRIMINSYTCK